MKNYFNSFKSIYESNCHYVLILTLIISNYIFIVNLILFYDNGITEYQERLLFILGWFTVTTYGILIIFFLEFIRQKFFKNFIIYYSLIVLLNLLILNFLFFILRIFSINFDKVSNIYSFINNLDNQVPTFWTYAFEDSVESIESYDLVINFKLLKILFYIICFLNILFLFLFYKIKNNVYLQNKYNNINSSIETLYPFLILLIFFHFSNFRPSGLFGDIDTYFIYGIFLIPLIFLLSFISFFHLKLFRFINYLKISFIFYVILIFIIIFLIYDPGLIVEPFHQNSFIGPIVDLRAGKFLLVGINSQYGAFNILFLKWVFDILPISHTGLSFVTIVLYFFQYLITFSLFKFVTKSNYFSLLSLIILILIQYYSFYNPVHQYPASGPIRFLPALLIIYFELQSIKLIKYKLLFQALSILIIGLSSISGIDYFIFSFFTFLAMKTYQTFIQRSLKIKIKNFIIYLLSVLFFSFICHLFFNFYTYLNTNIFPSWNVYFNYLAWYFNSEWALRIQPFSTWIFFILAPLSVFYFIFFNFIFKLYKEFNNEFIILIGMAALAISQFTYFLGRSHIENLFAISLPSIFIYLVFIYFLSKNANSIDRKHFRSLMFCIYFVLFFTIIKISPNVYRNFFHIPEQSRIYNYEHIYSNLKEVFSPKPSSDRIEEIISLVQNYSADKNRIGIFLRDYENTEVLMFTNKAHILSFNFLPQQLRLNSNKKHIINEVNKIKVDDILYVNFKCDFQDNYNLDNYNFDYSYPCDDEYLHGRTKDLYSHLFQKIKDKYVLSILNTTNNGISVVKLDYKYIE